MRMRKRMRIFIWKQISVCWIEFHKIVSLYTYWKTITNIVSLMVRTDHAPRHFFNMTLQWYLGQISHVGFVKLFSWSIDNELYSVSIIQCFSKWKLFVYFLSFSAILSRKIYLSRQTLSKYHFNQKYYLLDHELHEPMMNYCKGTNFI